MNSDESVISLMPLKYPYLIPNTVAIYLKDMINKVNIYSNVNRKPEHTRYFRGAFDSEGNVLVK
jgi:hypothetical protein